MYDAVWVAGVAERYRPIETTLGSPIGLGARQMNSLALECQDTLKIGSFLLVARTDCEHVLRAAIRLGITS